MTTKPGDTVAVQFPTSGSTGAAVNADSLPTGVLIRNGDNTAETVTITNVTTGVYKASVTIPAGYSAGDLVALRIAATIGGVAVQGIVWVAVLDSHRNADLSARLPAALVSGRMDSDVGNIQSDAVDADVLAASAIAEIQNGLATAAALQLVDDLVDDLESRLGIPAGASIAADIAAIVGGATTEEIVAAILDIATADATGVGTLAKLIVDKLGLITTSTYINVNSPIYRSELTITKSVSLDTGALSATVPGTWAKCLFTLKGSLRDEDGDALVQVQKSNPADPVNDGLIVLNGAAGEKANGAITVDAVGNTVTIVLADDATNELAEASGLIWDVKFLVTGGSSTRPLAGTAEVALPATLAIT